jgi:hypothetical protein
MGLDNVDFSIIVRDFDIDENHFNMTMSLSQKLETFAFEFIETPTRPIRVTAFRPIEARKIRKDDDEVVDEVLPPTTEYFLSDIPASVIETAMTHIDVLQGPQMNVELLRLGMPEYFARRFVGFEPFKGFAGLNQSRARKIMVLFAKIVSLVMSTAAANWPEDMMPISWTVGIFSESTDISVPCSITSNQFASLSAENWADSSILSAPRTIKNVPRVVESGRAIVPSTGSPLPPSYVIGLNLADQTISNPLIKDNTLKSIMLDAVIDIVNKDLNLNDRAKLSFLSILSSDYLDSKPVMPGMPVSAHSSAASAPAAASSAPAQKRKSGDRFSTVKLAWDNIESQYPEIRQVSEETRRSKLKSIESEIRGNRFAKPPKGTCGAGGNNRDFRAKVPHLMREMQEAAYAGVSKHDFYHLLSTTDIFYTKTGTRDREEPENAPAAFTASAASSAASEPEFLPEMTLGEMQKAALSFRSQVMSESGFAAIDKVEKPNAKKRRRSDSEESYEPERPRRSVPVRSYCDDDDGMYD